MFRGIHRRGSLSFLAVEPRAQRKCTNALLTVKVMLQPTKRSIAAGSGMLSSGPSDGLKLEEQTCRSTVSMRPNLSRILLERVDVHHPPEHLRHPAPACRFASLRR